MASSNPIAYATGRRKTSVARVFLRHGTGKIIVNKKPIEEYFDRETSIMIVNQPLKVTNSQDKFDISANVRGGGSSGQAGAILLGIARALVSYNEETLEKNATSEVIGDESVPQTTEVSIRKILRKHGHLTRDPRAVERKKFGCRKARKKPQYSKR